MAFVIFITFNYYSNISDKLHYISVLFFHFTYFCRIKICSINIYIIKKIFYIHILINMKSFPLKYYFRMKQNTYNYYWHIRFYFKKKVVKNRFNNFILVCIIQDIFM